MTAVLDLRALFVRTVDGGTDFDHVTWSDRCWWQCQACLREYTTNLIQQRKKTHPFCGGCALSRAKRGRSVADMATPHTFLANLKRPGFDRYMTGMKSGDPCRWRCVDGHEWVTNPARLQGCPYCAGQRAIIGKTDLATTRPDLAAQFKRNLDDPDRSPEQLMKHSRDTVVWRCTAGHETTYRVIDRQAHMGCPVCTNSVGATPEWNLATERPEVAADFVRCVDDPTLGVTDLTPRNGRLCDWRCATCGHEWTMTVDVRRGCPACAGQAATEANSLASRFPDLVAEFVRNVDRPEKGPDAIGWSSSYRCEWRCGQCANTWETLVEARTRAGSGCPFCVWAAGSRIEIAIWHELAAFLDLAPRRVNLPVPGRSRPIVPDVYAPAERLVVEYDGEHAHRGRETRDRKRVKEYGRLGLTVVRVREGNLGPVGEHDLSIEYPYKSADPAKTVVDQLLPHLEVVLGRPLATAGSLGVSGYLARTDRLAAAAAEREMGRSKARSPEELGRDDADRLAGEGWDRDAIVAAYEKEGTIAGLGERLGFSSGRVMRLLDALGIERRVGGRRSETCARFVSDPEWFAARVAEGLSKKDIAARAGCSVQSAHMWSKRHGIPCRP